jgi:hypothetical protein
MGYGMMLAPEIPGEDKRHLFVRSNMSEQTSERSSKALSVEPIRWLHLSDFHVGKDEAGQRQMFKDLLKHIEDTIQEEQSGPHHEIVHMIEEKFIFITLHNILLDSYVHVQQC